MATQTKSESQFPVVDFSNENMKPGNDEWLEACKVVRRGFEDHGGFLARFDKVGPELLKSVFSSMEELLSLPLETKRRKTSDKPKHGYVGEISKFPLYESLAVDNASNIEDCKKFSNIMWPEGNSRFSYESVNTYTKILKEWVLLLALPNAYLHSSWTNGQTVKKMVFDSYGLDKQKCESFLESTDYLFRGYKYRIPEMDESNEGVGSHTDTTIITILHQKVNGLEIKLKDGEWFGVDASPSFFCVLAGDAFMAWSNERIRACEHRVMLKSRVTRYSLGVSSYSTQIVKAPEELVDEEHPIRYKPFDHYEYLSFLPLKAGTYGSNLKAYCGI